MQSGFFRAICQAGIFMICAQAVVHFRPKGAYEKYFKLLVSVMVLIQIFQPISRLFAGGVKQDLEGRAAWFAQQMEESMEQASESARESEKLLEEMTLGKIQERLGVQSGQDEEETLTREGAGQEEDGGGPEEIASVDKVGKIRIE